MKKPYKVLSATALAGAMALSTLTPVTAFAAEQDVPVEAKELGEIVLKIDGKDISLSLEDYLAALPLGIFDPQDVSYVVAQDGSVYTLDDYLSALPLKETVEGTLEFLYEGENAVEVDIIEGEIKDGKVVPKTDEQPEDRLNETFFYNVA